MTTRSSGQRESAKGRLWRRLMLAAAFVNTSAIPGEGFDFVRMEVIHGIPKSAAERPQEVDS